MGVKITLVPLFLAEEKKYDKWQNDKISFLGEI